MTAEKPWLTSYADGVLSEIGEVTETLPEMLRNAARKYGRRTAMVFFGKETRYRDLERQVTRVAGALRRFGVSAGDRVALVLPNCPQHVIAFYAALRLGAIVVEHNPLYTERELRHQFEDHGAQVAIVWDKAVDTIARFPADVRPAHIISVDMTEAMPLPQRIVLRLPVPKARQARHKLTTKPTISTGVIPWRRVQNHRPLSRRVPIPKLDDVALLQYTSGTTGTPKGAMLTHRSLRANAMQGRAWLPGLEEGKETVYAVLPLFHAYGLTLCLTFAMSIGATLVLFPAFDVALVATALRKHPPTFLPAVPPIYDRLARAATREGLDLSTIRFAISGAMPLPVDTVARWEEATGGLLVEGYGMTESSPVALGNPVGPTRRPGTVGVPFPSTTIRIVEPDDPATDVPHGKAGELLIHGPQVFIGYWNRPDDTAETLLNDGWLCTGDIVTIADDGFVTVVDRRKELIITGGFNVSPSEVEETLRTHPDVADVAVVSLPRGDGTETVAAAIILQPTANTDASALRDYCRTRLADYKVPRRLVFVDDLPRSLIGKVLRREVRDQLLNAH